MKNGQSNINNFHLGENIFEKKNFRPTLRHKKFFSVILKEHRDKGHFMKVGKKLPVYAPLDPIKSVGQ